MSIFLVTCYILIIEQLQLEAYQNKMESPGFPLLYRLLAVLGNVVLDFHLLHERGKDGLINGAICHPGE